MSRRVRTEMVGVLRAQQNEINFVAVKFVFGKKFFGGVECQIARGLVLGANVSALHADFFYEARVDEFRVVFNLRGQES